MRITRAAVLCTLAAAACLPAGAAVTGHWDFSGNLFARVGAPLQARGTPAFQFGTTASFGIANIKGEVARVMKFPAGSPSQGFVLSHGGSPNGGGAKINRYTLVMDVLFPSSSTGYRCLWQTDTSDPTNTDGDLFVNPADGIGISGQYHGHLTPDAWHRVVFTIDLVNRELGKFIDGINVLSSPVGAAPLGTNQMQYLDPVTGSRDGRWSLGPTALLFADDDNETAVGYVNSLQFRDGLLTAGQIVALGGPVAEGIPLTIPTTPTLRLVSPNGGENFQAGSTQIVAWETANPNGLVQIDLYRDHTLWRALAQVPLRQSNYVWTLDQRLGDTNNYRIKLTSLNFASVEDSSDDAFSVFGSQAPANALFGQPLQSNGGFEQLLADWQTISGNPTTLINGSKRAPHSGARFLHGGLNATNHAVVRQDISLLAAGFTAQDIDEGAALQAEAWLRNWIGAGTFDDQVYYRVGYLDGAAQELASLRCMVAADSAWVPRTLSGLVPAGTRSLRLEVVGQHRRDRDNDSMADDLIVRLQEVQVPRSPEITKLPMLQDVRTNAMRLLWETDGNLAVHAVEWGRSSVSEHTLSQVETLQIDNTHFVHRATLTGLETETAYVYRVRSGTNVTAAYSFRTAPQRDTAFAVAWWGDNHQGTVTLRTHVANLLAHGPDLIAVAGDMVNSGNNLSEWHDYWFKPLEHLNLAQTRPVIFARGNHDGEHALAYAYSTLPGNEAWFAFDYGNSRFIFLDSEVDTGGSPEQFAWLQAELARPETQRAAFRIVCFHRPPYANLWNGGGYTGEPFVRSDWVPLFAQRNVDIVISGHAHNYNRGVTNGVTYVVSGGGGGTLDVERVARWALYTVEYSRYHFDLMEVNGDTLHWQTFDDNNQIIDMFTLQSRVPSLEWQKTVPVDGKLPLVLSGKPGVTYVLQHADQLGIWTPYTTNTFATNGPSLKTNLVPVTGGQRFFRAQIKP